MRDGGPAEGTTGPGDEVAEVRRVLVVDRRLSAADRLLGTRLWTRGTAEQAAEHLGHARWALLAAECRAAEASGTSRPASAPGPASTPHPGGDGEAGPAPRAVGAPEAVAEWERRRRAAQSAELARLLTRFAVRTGVTTPPAGPVRLVLLEDAWRLGDPLRDRAAARARRELLACPVVAYGARPHPWMVFAAPAAATVPAWRVEGRMLLTDLGVAAGPGDRATWRAFAVLLERGMPGRCAHRAARADRS